MNNKKIGVFTMLSILFLIYSMFLLKVVNAVEEKDKNPQNEKLNSINDVINQHKDKISDYDKNILVNYPDKSKEFNFIIRFNQEVKTLNFKKAQKIKDFQNPSLKLIKSKIEDFNEIISDSNIKYIEIDKPVKIPEININPKEKENEEITWNIEKTLAKNAWNFTKGDKVIIVIIDSGIDYTHKDLRDRVIGGFSLVDNDYIDFNGHGTLVAGIVASSINNQGIIGVSPNVSIYSIKITNSNTGNLSTVISALEHAIGINPDIILMSFGFDFYSQILKDIIEEAYSNGIILIAAAGNTGDTNILYPAKYDDVIAVGAVDENNQLASFSSYGLDLELVAPGKDILSTTINNQYATVSGTSLAAPHTAGISALIKSYNSSLTNEQIRGKLRNDAFDLGIEGKDQYYGYGLAIVNLESQNYTSENETYYFEVYKVEDFYDESTYKLYYNGTGTVEDIKFEPGLYVVYKYIGDEIIKEQMIIKEEGEFYLLATPGFDDNWTNLGSTTADKLTFKGSSLKVNISLNIGDPAIGVECFNYDDIASNTFDECFAIDAATLSNCRQQWPELDNICLTQATCYNSGAGTFHPIDTSIPKREDANAVYYSSSCVTKVTMTKEGYFIFNSTDIICTSSTTYDTRGFAPIEIKVIKLGNSCAPGTICDQSKSGVKNYSSNPIIDPCITACAGKIQVIAEDSKGRGIENVKIFLNGTFQGNTNDLGVFNVSSTSPCGIQQTIDVKCSDNTFCDSGKVSIDFPNENESITFDCTMCLGIGDLFISQQDVTISTSGALSLINATVHSTNVEANNNLTVRFQTIGKDGLIKDTINNIVSIAKNSIKSTTANINLTDKDFVTIYVDPDNKFFEQKINNFVLRSTAKRIKANFDINTGIQKANEAIQDCLEVFAEPVQLSEANVIIAVGRFSQNIVNDIVDNDNFIDNNGWGFKNEKIFADGQFLELPYNAILGSYKPFLGTRRLVALGTGIDGTIAAVKKMAATGSIYLNSGTEKRPLIILDRYDLTAIGVFDILHNTENSNSYMANNDNFKNAISKSLSGNTFDIAIRRVNTTINPVTLRIKNVNSEFSQDYKDAVVENPMPVIFSGGLFSDLFRWEQDSFFGFSKGLAKQLAESGRDSWEIEITGGPLIERNNDPNYNYSDLVDSYWPASIAAIQFYTGKITTDYVGHSNGCRVALSSLEKYQTTGKSSVAKVQDLETGQYLNVNLQGSSLTPIVDTGVGCPGAFEGDSLFISCMQEHGQAVIDYFVSLGRTHFSQEDFIERLAEQSGPFSSCYLLSIFIGSSPNSISLNLGKDYLSFIQSTIDSQPGIFTINRTGIIYGRGGLSLDLDDDTVVTENDSIRIFSNINANNKTLNSTPLNHEILVDDPIVKGIIRKRMGS